MSIDPKKLRAYIAQYESREDARAAAIDDQRQLLKDAEEIDGINPKILRRLIKELKKPRAEVAAEEALLQEYRDAYLSFESTPLGARAAKVRDDTTVTISTGDQSVTMTGADLKSLGQASVPEIAAAIGEGVEAKVTRIFAEAERLDSPFSHIKESSEQKVDG